MTHTIIGKGLFLCFMLAIVALVTGCAMVPRDVEVPEARTPYILGVGDVLHITVYGQDGLTGDFRVDAKGNISYPLINTIQVAGFTTTDIESVIREKLDPDYIVDPRVSIEVLNYRSIYVLGEVNQPGKYEYAPDMTAMQAIAAAGGYTYRANENSVDLTRHIKGAIKTYTVDQTTLIKPGDTLTIKRRWF